MSMQSNPGWGSLFQNKQASGSQPQYRGNACCPHCQAQVELAGWKKTTQRGDPYLNLKLQPPRQRQEDVDPDPFNGDDDIPF